MRNSSGLAAACFTLGALIYRAMKAKISGEYAAGRQFLIFFAVAIALSSILAGVNAYGREAQNPEGFVAYDEARSAYMDYPRDSYGENSAAYEKAGWDETLAAMTDSWFYMDERVTTEAFNTIAQSSAFAAMGAGEKLSVGLSSLKTLLENYPLAVYEGLMVAASYLAALALFLLRRKHWISILGASAYLLGSAVLLSYLLSQGRINLRVWMTVSILSCVAIWLCALTAYGTGEEEKAPSKKRAARFVLVGLMLLVSLGLSYKVFRTVVSYENETPDTARTLPRGNGLCAGASGQCVHPRRIRRQQRRRAERISRQSADEPHGLGRMRHEHRDKKRTTRGQRAFQHVGKRPLYERQRLLYRRSKRPLSAADGGIYGASLRLDRL